MISLVEKYPEIAALWHPDNNISPNNISFGSHKIAKWICPISDDHIWSASINALTNNRKSNPTGRYFGCPFCHGLKVCNSNCLTTTHPDLVLQWDYDANNILPSHVTAGSHKNVWWKCKTGLKDHVWQAAVKSRATGGDDCPFCRGLKICETNCLANASPNLALEWNYNKNDKSPHQVTPGSHYKAWWICKQNHEWIATVKDRFGRKSNCPFCYQSLGEKRVENYLKNIGISYECQYKFDKCKKKYRLRFDFVIMKDSVPIAAIEYNGIQHYKPIGFGGNPEITFNYIRENDDIKKDFLKNNDINYLEIPYTNYDKIELEIENFLKEIRIKD